jgi:hypothetical protein
MCHNSNCAGPADPSHDDTIAALRESLALTYDGRPMLDGVEIDLFWHGASGRCLFAHDASTADTAPEAMTAAQAIASYLAIPGPRSFDGGPFLLRMELKGFVGALSDEHTDQQAVAHANCALDVFETWNAAAVSAKQPIIVIFDSSAPRLLRAVTDRSRWPGKHPNPGTTVWLSADFVDSTPSGLALQKLEDFPKVDDVVFHSGWVTSGHYEAFKSMDVNLTMWMFSATVETFDAMRRLEPDVALTSEAPLVRRWLEY